MKSSCSKLANGRGVAACVRRTEYHAETGSGTILPMTFCDAHRDAMAKHLKNSAIAELERACGIALSHFPGPSSLKELIKSTKKIADAAFTIARELREQPEILAHLKTELVREGSAFASGECVSFDPYTLVKGAQDFGNATESVRADLERELREQGQRRQPSLGWLADGILPILEEQGITIHAGAGPCRKVMDACWAAMGVTNTSEAAIKASETYRKRKKH